MPGNVDRFDICEDTEEYQSDTFDEEGVGEREKAKDVKSDTLENFRKQSPKFNIDKLEKLTYQFMKRDMDRPTVIKEAENRLSEKLIQERQQNESQMKEIDIEDKKKARAELDKSEKLRQKKRDQLRIWE